MTWSIEKKTAAALTAAGLILLLVSGLSYRNGRGFVETSEWVSHTHEVLQELEATLAAVANAQTTVRGYIITGEDTFLEPYHTAVREVREHLRRLRFLTADNPVQQRRLAALERVITEKLDSLQTNINLRREQGFETARQRVASGVGIKQMDQVRALIADMKHEEE